MRLPLIPLLIILVLNLFTDFYIFRCLFAEIRKSVWSKIQFWSAIVLNLGLIALMVMPVRQASDSFVATLMWVVFVYLSIYLPKYIFVIFDALSRLPQIWDKQRFKWLSITGIVLTLLTFMLVWWGALFNRFNIDERSADIYITDLPQSFDGFKIVQISDLHVGTYGTDTTYIAEIVEHINALQPDVVLFTGDIVNRKTDELLPFVNTLNQIDAQHGVYAILGNHDYGDYYDWPDEQARLENNARLAQLYDQMGWHLLNNKYDFIYVDNDSLAIIGVENIGDPPFHVYGDLTKAYPDINDNVTKILMSHNPAHWENEIADSDKNIALTLSGHTHAMQISLLGLSPAAFRYRTWGGLYSDTSGNHKLYVNIGIGTVGFPARIGATPEITLLTLRKP